MCRFRLSTHTLNLQQKSLTKNKKFVDSVADILVKVVDEVGEAGEGGDPAVGQPDAVPGGVRGELLVHKLQLRGQPAQVSNLREGQDQHHPTSTYAVFFILLMFIKSTTRNDALRRFL